ncbi:MAG: AAA family ATPase [Actinobacteria bacterium]|nr:AAA family ATPase [Actinomycetota bacterium]MCL6088378.1 AAA family ATPase [Actinomycetota bacterium]
MDNINIAVAGKGGTGKTTVSALMIRILIESGKGTVLALDADPNSNLNEMLGVKVTGTVGELVENFKKDGAALPKGMYKDQMVEMNLHQSVIEGKGFDLLVMGRGEGPGCYCAANNLFRKYIDMLQKNYNYVVMDNEAGMEHISRKTTSNVDFLLLVSDPSMRGIATAARLRDLTRQLKINAGKIFLIVNRINGNLDPKLKDYISEQKFETIGLINSDEAITDMELSGKSVFDLPNDSISLNQVKEIIKKLSI